MAGKRAVAVLSAAPLELLRFTDAVALAAAAATEFVQTIVTTIAERGRCRLALAGGSSPKAIYQRIASASELSGRVDWERVEVFWGDERCVPPDHEQSNHRMAREALLRHVPVRPEFVHRIRGEIAAVEAAREYTAVLGSEPLDLVVLGMGDDGHTASLFPGRPEADEGEARVVAARAPVAPYERVSLTQRVFAESTNAMFWVSGSSKAERVAAILAEVEQGRPRLPAARVRPRGRLRWFVDECAARALPSGLAQTSSRILFGDNRK